MNSALKFENFKTYLEASKDSENYHKKTVNHFFKLKFINF